MQKKLLDFFNLCIENILQQEPKCQHVQFLYCHTSHVQDLLLRLVLIFKTDKKGIRYHDIQRNCEDLANADATKRTSYVYYCHKTRPKRSANVITISSKTVIEDGKSERLISLKLLLLQPVK